MKSSKIDWKYELKIFKKNYENNKLYEGSNADTYFNNFRENFYPSNNNYNILYFPPNDLDKLFNIIDFYKELLKRIKDESETQYNNIHKGTPFFFIGWFSFLLKNYNEAIYYIDAAMNEDKKNHPSDVWPTSGAALFFRLHSIYDKYFNYFTDTTIHDILEKELKNFSQEFENFELSEFKEYFIEELLLDEDLSSGDVAIITTFYTFILEKNDILNMINLRGTNGGTIEPMIMHLFKGSLIFESLLKKYHPSEALTLGQIFREIGSDYGLKYEGKNCYAGTLEEIFDIIDSPSFNKIEKAFYTTCRIRNTTGHNLSWNNVFSCENYEQLYKNVLNAILIVIKKNIKIKS